MKRLVDYKDIDYIRTELMFLRAMVADDVLKNRLSELYDFVDTALVDVDRDTRNVMKRDVYKKIKAADTPEEAEAWYEVYKQIDQVYKTDVTERVNVRPHYGR
jgi:hypothetical protein